jgi:site-specific recombinase XerD
MKDPIYSMKKEMLRRKYSLRTIDSYLFCLNKFFKATKKDPRHVGKRDVKKYLDDLSETNKAGSTMNIYLSALRFFVQDVMHKDINLNIRYSRRPKTLPVVLTKEETKKLFDAVTNSKHKLMLELMYSAGLRVSELLNLRIRDFESNHGWVRRGKGNKDRPFIIAEKLKERIEDHIKENNIEDYLFIGWNGTKMSVSTVQEIVKKARKKAKIKKNVHPHTLRHSFATHLIEDGYKVTDVQPLLGHSSLQTTMKYVHIASPQILSVKSPFDNL